MIRKTKYLVFFLLLISCHALIYGQQKISGFIKDAISGERLIGASVLNLDKRTGVVSDQNGFFSLIVNLPTNLRVSYVGYESQIFSLSRITKDTLIEITLNYSETPLKTVEIRTPYHRPTFNIAKLTTTEVANIPSLTGKPDVLKAMQFLPGIRSQGEASSVTLVRGGNPGENLYLLDNTPLIYVHHIGGYMSVFNPDMIQDIEIHKGGFPAKYGEKLSSIMNISQKEGNKSGLQGSFSIGISDVSLTLEGPAKQKNSSFILTARKTLIDILYILGTGLATDAFLWYGFHDINGKYSWSPNHRNSFHFNFYQGDDYLQLIGKSKNDEPRFRSGNIWGNWLASGNWNHVFHSNLLLKNTLSFTHYRLKDVTRIKYKGNAAEKNESLNQQMRSSLQDISWRSDAVYLITNNWTLDFGLKLSYLKFKPMFFKDTRHRNFDMNEKVNALESGLYVSNRISLMDIIDAEIGLRGVYYNNSEVSNFSFEPRININFHLNEKNTINISGMRVSQNAQLLYNVGSLTANEIYIPSDSDIPVSYSNQYSIGYRTSILKDNYQIEANSYYKLLENLTTYKDGYGYAMGDMYWQEKLETGGKGLAQGFELMLRKNRGNWTGFASYTYSKSTRQFEHINNGKTYDFEYDSPHRLTLNLAYRISEKWSFGATWQYQSGLPYTPAIGRYITVEEREDGAYYPYEVLIYGDKNSKRMRTYHRLDVAFKYSTHTKKRHRKAEWTFGIYNVYNRQNPYFYYYNNTDKGEIYRPQYWEAFESLKLYQMSLFPFIPMVSYKAWFN